MSSSADNDIDFTAFIADLNNNDDGWQNLAVGTSVITTNPSLVAYSAQPLTTPRMTMAATVAASSSSSMRMSTTTVTTSNSSLLMVCTIADTPLPSTVATSTVTTAAAKKSRKKRVLGTSAPKAPKVPRLTGETVASSSAYVLSEGDRAMDLIIQSATTSSSSSSRFQPTATVTMPPMNPLHHDAQVWSLVNDVKALKRLVERQYTLIERYGDELRDVKSDIARLARGGRVTFNF